MSRVNDVIERELTSLFFTIFELNGFARGK